MCRPCADKVNANIKATLALRVAAGNCEFCNEPRGDDGTARFCRRHADELKVYERTRRERVFDAGRCPGHGALYKLELCPACLYEEERISVYGFTFAGLVPPPLSGDKLESCVGCERCRRIYHKGGGYSHPRFPPDIKLRSQQFGGDGNRVWFRPDAAGEHVEVEFEACSLPGDECTDVLTRKAALLFLRDIRTGRRKTGACQLHVHDRARLTAAAIARAQKPTTVTDVTDNVQEKGDVGRKDAGRPQAFTDAEAWAAIEALPSVDVSKLSRALGCTRGAVRNWYERKGYASLPELLALERYKGGGRN